ncbi:hypothetical protein [Luteococcus japonicus]|uniref:Uncharacterized protein n=1 Tax=Luteococcus japonicus LSP_Lj1 TaxID=1255658 RepID=A0A1R4J7G7_9ACTN|nr:hypothetical protein [Luteococcus japonicus]SJN28026.1 hypothetical protein FM114_05915 [Luteococcus japonicus LSP_Lj1]
MNNVLKHQVDEVEAPSDDKRSNWSVALCRDSFQSITLCVVK